MEGPTSPLPTRVIALAMLLLPALTMGCSQFIGTTATSFMKRVRESDDPNLRYRAYANLADPGCYFSEEQKVQAVQLLSAALEPGKEPLATRAVICRTLGELGKPEAREALVASASDPDARVRAEACRALGKVGTAEDVPVLAKVMSIDRQADCRIAAIEGLGELKAADARAQQMLAENMEHNDPAVRLASLRALRKISGQDLGVEAGPWRDYAEKLAAASPPAAKTGEARAERTTSAESTTPAPATPRRPTPQPDLPLFGYGP